VCRYFIIFSQLQLPQGSTEVEDGEVVEEEAEEGVDGGVLDLPPVVVGGGPVLLAVGDPHPEATEIELATETETETEETEIENGKGTVAAIYREREDYLALALPVQVTSGEGRYPVIRY
jgi:hypothetical protein